jgi:hypothetical protein
MHATAISKIVSAVCEINKGINLERLLSPLPASLNKRWPATMLAINRMAKVMGRIKILIDSINTIKGINIKGVPPGTKWAKETPGEVTHPYATQVTQRVMDSLSGRIRWLVGVKI